MFWFTLFDVRRRIGVRNGHYFPGIAIVSDGGDRSERGVAQQHVVFGVPRFQHVPVAPNRRFVADHHDLFAGLFRHFLQGEVLHAMRD